jgi:glutamyl-tRNA reductase
MDLIEINRYNDISNFLVAGINYKKADALTRGDFAVNKDQYENILKQNHTYQTSFFILSTCNRTEIYGFAEDVNHLVDLLCTETRGSKEDFLKLSYKKSGAEAAKHLYHVAAGLDSQILGDYEIIGQLKQAVNIAREHGNINCFLDRLVNSVLQSSKAVKNNTALSDGTVSVSFAAVQCVKQRVSNLTNKKLLIVGVGKIGHCTCKNLLSTLPSQNITLINRSQDKAVQLATELGLQYAPIGNINEQIRIADIIIVATNASEPTVFRDQLQGNGHKLVIDMSIPNNVEASSSDLANITLINIDELSQIKDETLSKRKMEAPKAKSIIAHYLNEFTDWCAMRKNAAALNGVKTKLKHIYSSQVVNPASGYSEVLPVDKKIQRVINGMAGKMRVQNQLGCQYIEAINEFIDTAAK